MFFFLLIFLVLGLLELGVGGIVLLGRRRFVAGTSILVDGAENANLGLLQLVVSILDF